MPKPFNAQKQPETAKSPTLSPGYKKLSKASKCCAWCDAKAQDTLQWRSGPNQINLCNRCGLSYRRTKQQLNPLIKSDNILANTTAIGSMTNNPVAESNMANSPMAISNITNNSMATHYKNYDPMAINNITSNSMTAHYENYEPAAVSNVNDSNKLFYDDLTFIKAINLPTALPHDNRRNSLTRSFFLDCHNLNTHHIEVNNNIKPITIEKTKANKQTFFQPQMKITKALDDIQISAKSSKKNNQVKR
jgi:Zn ribbon nucleic-acid-binding protein